MFGLFLIAVYSFISLIQIFGAFKTAYLEYFKVVQFYLFYPALSPFGFTAIVLFIISHI